jgi:hypothetical protein
MRCEECGSFNQDSNRFCVKCGKDMRRMADRETPQEKISQRDPSSDLIKTPHCYTCGADWSKGDWTKDCLECGGGALKGPCVFCGGKCGGESSRAIMDSNDFGIGHWVGICGKN